MPSPQAVLSTRTTEPPGVEDVGVGGDRSGRAAAIGVAGPVIDGRRVDPVEHVEHPAGRRQHVVELAQDHRVLDVGAQLRRPRRVQGDGAEDPGETQRHRADQRRPTRPVGPVHAPGWRISRRRSASAKPLQRHRRQRPDQSAPIAPQSGA